MRGRQNGITFIGWLVLLVPVAIVGYSVMRLVPRYLNYIAVARTLERMAIEYKGDPQVAATSLRQALGKRFDIENIEFPSADDVHFTLDNGVWVAEVTYQDSVPLFSGIALTVDFEKRVSFK
jgi:Domain of unknown function (DUF4845)